MLHFCFAVLALLSSKVSVFDMDAMDMLRLLPAGVLRPDSGRNQKEKRLREPVSDMDAMDILALLLAEVLRPDIGRNKKEKRSLL